MDIAEVAKRAGVPASTLRYYEKKGLVESIGPEGTRRRFAPGGESALRSRYSCSRSCIAGSPRSRVVG